MQVMLYQIYIAGDTWMCVAQWPAQAARADRLRASELELA